MNDFILVVVSLIWFTEGVYVRIPGLGNIMGMTTSNNWTTRDIHEFYSIRYAMPPSGDLRFKPPVPVKPWIKDYDARLYDRPCSYEYQIGFWKPKRIPVKLRSFMPSGNNFEDCLTMNIFTPWIPKSRNDTSKKLLPVMVFIHGGEYANGGAGDYKPYFFLKYDIVFVVIQYRLGPFGFLSLHTDGIPGNMGLLDQVEALRFIYKYIRYFGGNRKQVTLFGQGSGASCITYLLLSPIVEPHLFKRVIIQSGSIHGHDALDENPLEIAKDLYKLLTKNDKPANVSTMEEIFMKANPYDLLGASIENYNLNGHRLKPVIQKAGDVKFLTKSPAEYLASGTFRRLPMVTGVTKDEGSAVTAKLYDNLKKKGVQDNNEFLRSNLTSATLDMDVIKIKDNTKTMTTLLNELFLKRTYNKQDKLKFKDIAPAITNLTNLFAVKGQVLKHAEANAKYNKNTYFYSFDYRGNYSLFLNENGTKPKTLPFDGGVTSGDDLIYLFPLFPLDKIDLKISQLMTELWVNFVSKGKPFSSKLGVNWEALKRYEYGPFLHISTKSYLCDDYVNSELVVSILNE